MSTLPSNGRSCPFCGQPINPGTGNMWHIESDFSSASPIAISFTRTYNSSLLLADSNSHFLFGAGWTTPYDTRIHQEVANPQFTIIQKCWKRNSDGFTWCDAPPVPQQNILSAVSILRPDGKKYLFNRDQTNNWTTSGNINDRLLVTLTPDGQAIASWTYVVAADDSLEKYDANGNLLSISMRNGRTQTLTYSAGTSNDFSVARYPVDSPICSNIQAGDVMPANRLLCVTDSWGRQLQFEYNSRGYVSKVIDSAGQAYLYEYDGASGQCTSPGSLACEANNLTRVTYPDARARTYYYDEANQIGGCGTAGGLQIHALTGLVDENGDRHISWTYDCYGRATSSQIGQGVEKVTLQYSNYSGAKTTTNVQYYAGASSSNPTTTSFNYSLMFQDAKNTGISGPCIECGQIASRVYDGNNNIAQDVDFNGNIRTYIFDLTRNLETQRTEASGSPNSRTISTEWDSTYRLPTKIAEANRITVNTYDANGNLVQKTMQATNDANGANGFSATSVGTPRVWSYTYNSFGQILTATNPNKYTTYYDYDTQGNLSAFKDALGHVTALSNYDGNGLVGMITDPNNLVTTLTYWPRGWLKSKTVGNEITTYDYDGVGQLKTITLPDRSVISYVYNSAHRLTDVTDSLGNSIHYTLDNMGNRTLEQVRDTTGSLKRQIVRVYDSLNRLWQVTGATQ